MWLRLISSNADEMYGSSSQTNLIVSIISIPLSCLSCPCPICSGQAKVIVSEEPAGERNTKSLTCGVAIFFWTWPALCGNRSKGKRNTKTTVRCCFMLRRFFFLLYFLFCFYMLLFVWGMNVVWTMRSGMYMHNVIIILIFVYADVDDDQKTLAEELSGGVSRYVALRCVTLRLRLR